LRGKRQHRNSRVPIRHPRQRIYTDEDNRAVLWLADLFDEIGSKRLRAAMDVELQTLYQRQYLQVSRACFKRQVISPATIDRLRQAERHTPRTATWRNQTRHTTQVANRRSHFCRLGQ
jgi:hypothetical protein